MKYIGPFMQWNTVQRLENIMYCKIPLKEKYNLHIKAELLVIVSSGESGMGQGGPYPGGGAASAQAGCRSARQHSVTILHASGPPVPQSLSTPPHRESGQDAELDAGPQREALLCTGSYYGLHCWYS